MGYPCIIAVNPSGEWICLDYSALPSEIFEYLREDEMYREIDVSLPVGVYECEYNIIDEESILDKFRPMWTLSEYRYRRINEK